jgi:hypothetical protein
MKRQPVTKAFVREECRTLGKKLRQQCMKNLSREIAGLARITQRSLKSIESRVTQREAKMKKRR